MKTLNLENSPIVYYIDETIESDWVVFLHAGFVDHRMFEKQYTYFSGKYNLLAIDILGHGNSTHMQKGNTIEKMSYWINQIFLKHSITAAHFVGVSLGSVFIQDFANKYEDKVFSLACYGGYNINNFNLKKQKSNSKSQIGMMLKAMFSIKWFAKANKKISAYTNAAQEEFYKMNIEFKKSSFMYLSKIENLVNKYPQKPRQYRLLVGCGEFDIPMEIEIVNEWSESEHCYKSVIQGAGHCANMDNPKEFNSSLENFWLRCQSEKI